MSRNGLMVSCLAVGFVALSALAAHAEEPAAATQEIALKGGHEKFRVPGGWKVEPAAAEKDLERWHVTLPGTLGSADILCGRYTPAREEVVATAAIAWQFPGAEFEAKPIPLTMRRIWGPESAEWLEIDTVRMSKRRGFLLVLRVARTAADEVRPAFVEAAKSFESTRPNAPGVPPEYKSVARDGYLYLLHPAVAATDVDPLHALFLSVEGPIAERYGGVPKSAKDPLVIVVHANAADSANLSEDAAEDRYGTAFDQPNGTLFTVPLPKDDWIAAGRLAEAWTYALMDQIFGVHFQSWLFSGEALLQACERTGGRQFPLYHERYAELIPKKLIPFQELADSTHVTDASEASAMVYLAFFRAAGARYSDAFADYAKQIRAGTNPKVALRRSLLALDQGSLNEAASGFLATFRAIEGR